MYGLIEFASPSLAHLKVAPLVADAASEAATTARAGGEQSADGPWSPRWRALRQSTRVPA